MERHVKWILVASLLINAVLVGFVVGQAGRGPIKIFDRRDMPAERRTDESARMVLKEAFDADRPALEAATEKAMEARREAVEILRVDPLNTEQLNAALEKLRVSTSATQEVFHHSLATAAAKLNAQQRASLGRMLDRGPRRVGNVRGPVSGALSDIVTGRTSEGPRGPIGGAVVDIINGPPPAPPGGKPATLPDGMGLGAPAPPSE